MFTLESYTNSWTPLQMFEHMKNYQELMRKVAGWLKPNADAHGGEALVFIHIFCHNNVTYDFVSEDGWMAQNFFTGKESVTARNGLTQ
jgi:hypothetical protein